MITRLTTALATLLFVCAAALSLLGVEGSRGPCGTIFLPAYNEDMLTGTACEKALGQRRAWAAGSVIGSAVVGVVPILIVARRRRAQPSRVA